MKQIFDMFVDHWIEMPEQGFTKPINYVMASNGCFEIRETPLGRTTVRTQECPGLQTQLEERVELSIPLMPGSLLMSTLHFFRTVYREKQQAEAFLQFFLDQETGEYFLHCPPQQVSGAMVKFLRDPELESRYLLVMDIHSHNSMPAFFSGIDDDDEQEDRLYGVIGCVHQRIPHFEFRMGVAGRFLALDGRQLFDGPAPAQRWSKEWLNRCYTSHVSRHSSMFSLRNSRDSQENMSRLSQETHPFSQKEPSRPFSSRYPRYRRDPRWGKEWEDLFTNTGSWDEEPIFLQPSRLPIGWTI